MSQHQTLADALNVLGIKHVASNIAGKRDWYSATGEFIGSFDASEGWDAIKRGVAAVQSEHAA